MTPSIRIDDLDRDILNALMNDARIPYAEMAKRFNRACAGFLAASGASLLLSRQQ